MNAVVALAAMMLCCTVALTLLIIGALYHVSEDEGGMSLYWQLAGVAFSGVIYFGTLVLIAQARARKLYH